MFSSIAVLHVEKASDSNIKSAEDAIWWSFVTITTVGYGDRFPVTAEGRFVAAILMCAGVGLFGTFSAFLAAWLISPDESGRENELSESAFEKDHTVPTQHETNHRNVNECFGRSGKHS